MDKDMDSLALWRLFSKKEAKMKIELQKLKKEIFEAVVDNMEEYDVYAIIERSVNMTLKYGYPSFYTEILHRNSLRKNNIVYIYGTALYGAVMYG